MNVTNSIYRRLAALQQIADANRPAPVTVHFADGNTTVTTPGEAMDAFRARGQSGEIVGFQADGPMSGWAQLLTILLHPRENREISDYE